MSHEHIVDIPDGDSSPVGSSSRDELLGAMFMDSLLLTPVQRAMVARALNMHVGEVNSLDHFILGAVGRVEEHYEIFEQVETQIVAADVGDEVVPDFGVMETVRWLFRGARRFMTTSSISSLIK